MPKMDGLTALKKIMKDCPTSVIMISSLTTEGADATMEALQHGAVDFIPKEMSFVNVNIVNIKEELIRKVKEISRNSSLRMRLNRIMSSGNLKKIIQPAPGIIKAIGIGISTGGPLSLQKVIPNIDRKLNCPVFIVQHMPPKFTKSLADRLNGMTELHVKEAENGEIAEKGTVYIAPGGLHMTIESSGTFEKVIRISNNPPGMLHKPSVDIMLNSIAEAYGKNLLGIIMTGMGKDGLEGIKKLKAAGGYCITQDEETCVVYGMPKAVADAGLSDASISLENIAGFINKSIKI
jgi:two-component system, chemotaxis family, protein-glutamate methylesterase/glutaminase